MAHPNTPAGKPAEPDLAICTVALRRTVKRAGKSYGPGAVLRLPPDEARRLQALGFLASSTAPAVETIGPAPASIVKAG